MNFQDGQTLQPRACDTTENQGPSGASWCCAPLITFHAARVCRGSILKSRPTGTAGGVLFMMVRPPKSPRFYLTGSAAPQSPPGPAFLRRRSRSSSRIRSRCALASSVSWRHSCFDRLAACSQSWRQAAIYSGYTPRDRRIKHLSKRARVEFIKHHVIIGCIFYFDRVIHKLYGI